MLNQIGAVMKILFISLSSVFLLVFFNNCTGLDSGRVADLSQFSPENTAVDGQAPDGGQGTPEFSGSDGQSEFNPGIIFETDFREDVGYRQNYNNGWNRNDTIPPVGFNAIRVGGDPGSFVEVVTDESQDGAALALHYRQASSGRSSISLARHLTGDRNTGYSDLYVRYKLKFPENFIAGDDGRGLPFWKWGRLWQNTSPEIDDTWTENRVGSGYVVWGLGSGFQGNQHFYGAWSDNTVPGNHERGSNGGPMQTLNWYRSIENPAVEEGFFAQVGDGAWQFDSQGFFANREQDYHTLEWHFVLTPDLSEGYGLFELFIDGVRIIDPSNISNAYGAPVRQGVPTVIDGSGFNHITVFDNMQSWSELWGNPNFDGFVLIDDVVVSTQRIGHDYIPSATTPVMTSN